MSCFLGLLVDSAELFLNSSFGIGPELALSDRNAPSIFPDTSLAVRLEAEPIRGYPLLEERVIRGARFVLGNSWWDPTPHEVS